VVLPPLEIAAVIIGVLAIVLGTVAVLAARTYGRSTLGERRGGRARQRSPALAPGTDASMADAAMADAIVGSGLIRIHPTPGGQVAALRGLDITIGAGEVAAVIGPSGSGSPRCSGSSPGWTDPPPAGSSSSGRT
jgi:hypothetical protein